MSKGRPLPILHFTPVVRPHHGNTFAEEWFRLSLEGGALSEPFTATHLIEWPCKPDGSDDTPRVDRYEAIETEILQRTLDAIRPAIMEAFVRIASEVLARERQRQANGQK